MPAGGTHTVNSRTAWTTSCSPRPSLRSSLSLQMGKVGRLVKRLPQSYNYYYQGNQQMELIIITGCLDKSLFAVLTALRVLGYCQIELVVVVSTTTTTAAGRRLILHGVRVVASAACAIVVAHRQVLYQTNSLGDSHMLLLCHLAEGATGNVHASLQNVLRRGRTN